MSFASAPYVILMHYSESDDILSELYIYPEHHLKVKMLDGLKHKNCLGASLYSL